MTSRTNRDREAQDQKGNVKTLTCDRQQRRQDAIERYLAGDPIEVICREMGCSKSWLYKWKNRYQAADPGWSKEYSRRPETTPAKTSEALEAQIIRLRHALSLGESKRVSARMIRDHLRQHRSQSIPSLRTIYRILNRHTKEVPLDSFTT